MRKESRRNGVTGRSAKRQANKPTNPRNRAFHSGAEETGHA